MPSPVPGVAPLEPGGFAGTNPLGLISGLAGIQNQLNENRKFQQEFYANQAAGEIIARHPGDLEGAIQEMQGSGLAGFMGPAINNARSLALMQAQQQQIEASAVATHQQALLSGRDAVIKAGMGAVKDYTLFPKLAQAGLSGLDPRIRNEEAQYVRDVANALVSDVRVPDGQGGEKIVPFESLSPQQKQEVFNQRYNGFMTGAGVSAQEVGSLVGPPKEFETGARTGYGVGGTATGDVYHRPGEVTLPSSVPQTAEGALPRELAPTLSQQGAQAAGGVQGLPPGGGGGQAPNISGAASGVMPGPQASAGAPQGGAQPAYKYAAGYPDDTKAFDGKPLVNKPDLMHYKGFDPSAVGGLNEAQVKSNTLAVEKLHEDDKAAAAAQQTENLLRTMDESYDLLKSKNLGSNSVLDRAMVTGPLAPGLLAMGRTFNQVAGIMGGKGPVFDPTSLAVMENMHKAHEQLKYSFLSQNLGTQREAASTIVNAGQAVPGLENTLLGGKLVTAEVRAATQWIIDHDKFVTEYQAANKGTLLAAEQSWMAQHDPHDYANKVLADFGIVDGKMTKPALKQAVADGWLNRDDGVRLLHEYYPGEYTDTRKK